MSLLVCRGNVSVYGVSCPAPYGDASTCEYPAKPVVWWLIDWAAADCEFLVSVTELSE